MEKQYKRRIYFIEKAFQTKFILKFCAIVGIGGLLTVGILYLLAGKTTTVSIVNSRVVVRTTADFILPILIQTVAVVTAIVGLATVVLTLLVSHKIAGPLYRFKKVINLLEEGDFSGDFRIRLHDQLQDLAQIFNNMITKTRIQLKALRDNLLSLKEKLDNVSEQEVSEHKRSYLSELKRISAELNRILQHFKI